MSTRQFSRLLDEWVTSIGLRRAEYGTHSPRRTKAAMIYRATGSLRAIQILLGHTEIENTVRYLGVDIEDACCWLSEQRFNLGAVAYVRATSFSDALPPPSVRSWAGCRQPASRETCERPALHPYR